MQCEEGLLRAADNQRRKLDETQKQCTMVINRIKELEMQKEQLEGEVNSFSTVELICQVFHLINGPCHTILSKRKLTFTFCPG